MADSAARVPRYVPRRPLPSVRYPSADPPTHPGLGSAQSARTNAQLAFLLASHYGQLRSCFLTLPRFSLPLLGPGWRACSSFLLAGALLSSGASLFSLPPVLRSSRHPAPRYITLRGASTKLRQLPTTSAEPCSVLLSRLPTSCRQSPNFDRLLVLGTRQRVCESHLRSPRQPNESRASRASPWPKV